MKTLIATASLFLVACGPVPGRQTPAPAMDLPCWPEELHEVACDASGHVVECGEDLVWVDVGAVCQ